MKNIKLYITLILLLTTFVRAGVVFPIPDLQLMPGESGRFQYAIQTGTPPVQCTMSLNDKTPLEISLDFDEGIVNAQSKTFYGTATAPREIPFGHYEETFCVTCESLSEAGGASLRQSFCDIPIKVDVVRERTKMNLQLPEKPKEVIDPIAIVGTIVLIILVIVLILFSVKKTKKK